jgi:hypothetical protein
MPSIFPSVYGEKGDVALFSQCFDDTAVLNQFQPPSGTELMGWTNEEDEVSSCVGMTDIGVTQTDLTSFEYNKFSTRLDLCTENS